MKIIFKILFFLWTATIFILSFYTPDWLHIDPPFEYPDKWKHAIGAFILAILFYSAWPRISIWKSLLAWVLITTIFETLQPVLTNGHRKFEVLDILMNIAGFSLVIFFINFAKSKRYGYH